VIDTSLVHATAIAIEGEAILLRGPPGAGKSDLALRLIEGGARLLADDQALLRRADNHVLVRAPAAIVGLIEVRGVGVVRVDALEMVLGLAIPVIVLAPFEASAAAKLRLAWRALAHGAVYRR